MTREEARDILKCEKNWEHRAGKKIHEALNMAIEALDQQTEYDRGYKDGVKDGKIGLLTDYNTACDYTFSGAKRLGYEEGLKDALEMTNEDCISREAVLEINESHHGQMPNEVNHQIWKEITAEEAIKLGERIEEGFRKGLSNDRNKNESKYF